MCGTYICKHRTETDATTMVTCILLLPYASVVAMSAVLEHLSPDFELIVATAGFLSVSLLFSLKVPVVYIAAWMYGG